MGVSLMTIIEEDAGDNDEAEAEAEAEADAAVDAEAGCFRAAAVAVPVPVPDDGNRHLLYIVTVGRLNGIILHR